MGNKKTEQNPMKADSLWFKNALRVARIFGATEFNYKHDRVEFQTPEARVIIQRKTKPS